MSIKYVHIVFVIAVTLLALGFAWWCFFSPESPQTTAYYAGGAAGVIVAFGAIAYGVWVWKKLKRIPIE